MTARRRAEGVSGESGFTLLELVIAISLLALVSLILGGGLRLGARVWDSGTETMAQISRIELVQGFLRRQFEGAAPLSPSGPRADRRYVFEGRRDQIRFAALAPAQFGVGGFYELTVKKAEGAEADQVVVEARLHHPEAHERPRASQQLERSVLLEEVRELKIEYYGRRRRRDELRWHDEWRRTRLQPLLVRIDIEFEDERLYWPTFVVAMKLSR